jgi:hypothetical protein
MRRPEHQWIDLAKELPRREMRIVQSDRWSESEMAHFDNTQPGCLKHFPERCLRVQPPMLGKSQSSNQAVPERTDSSEGSGLEGENAIGRQILLHCSQALYWIGEVAEEVAMINNVESTIASIQSLEESTTHLATYALGGAFCPFRVGFNAGYFVSNGFCGSQKMTFSAANFQ